MAYLGKPILAIDFDGTIRMGKRYNSKNNRLMPHCKFFIKKLYEHGCRFILWTTRTEESMDSVREVLKKNNILQYFEEINENVQEIRWWNTRKIYADYYIDDLNLGGFPGWLETYDILMEQFPKMEIDNE